VGLPGKVTEHKGMFRKKDKVVHVIENNTNTCMNSAGKNQKRKKHFQEIKWTSKRKLLCISII